MAFARPTAYGDALAPLLALVAIFAFFKVIKLGIFFTWLYSVVGVFDLISAIVLVNIHGVHPAHFGATWFLAAINVPALFVVHGLIVYLLFRSKTFPDPG